MHLNPSTLSHREVYNLLHGCVVPRPIAWVTTRSATGVVNVAPFSAFSIVSTRPPMLLISCGLRSGERKDTARNIATTGTFCINVVSQPLLESMHASSAEFPAETSEAEVLGITLEPCQAIDAPRIAAAPASFECRLHQILAFGDHSESFVGEVVNATIKDELYHDGRIDQEKLDAIGRIGGPTYVTPGRFINLKPVRKQA